MLSKILKRSIISGMEIFKHIKIRHFFPLIAALFSVILLWTGEAISQSNHHPIIHLTGEELLQMQKKQSRFLRSFSLSENNILPPASISLLGDMPYLGEKRNQADCGNCWVWAVTGALEIAHKKRYGIDNQLSIQYVNSNYNDGGRSGFFACQGASFDDYIRFNNTSGSIAIPWSNNGADYVDQLGGVACPTLYGLCSARAASDITETPYVQIDSLSTSSIETLNISKELAISNIKAELNAGRSVLLGFYLQNSTFWNEFFDFWVTAPLDTLFDMTPYNGYAWNSSEGGGHAVLVVGYNDLDSDPSKHYWEILNSWGVSQKRPEGTYRLKMDIDYSMYATYKEHHLGLLQWNTLRATFPPDPTPTPTPPPQPTAAPPAITTTTLLGHIRDVNYSGVAGIVVKLNDTHKVTTNENGEFLFSDIQMGTTCNVTFERIGYKFTPATYSTLATAPLQEIDVLVEADPSYSRCVATKLNVKQLIRYGTQINLIGENLAQKFSASTSRRLRSLKIDLDRLNFNLSNDFQTFLSATAEIPEQVYNCPRKAQCRKLSHKKAVVKSRTILRKMINTINNGCYRIIKKAPKQTTFARRTLAKTRRIANKSENLLAKLPRSGKVCN